EVEELDLWGTELVVLSACETDRGEVQVGEGVLGLRRAFQLAGAQTVLASLWMVPDAKTERRMSDCLKRWLEGTPPAAALRQAQLEMIRRLRQSANPRCGRRRRCTGPASSATANRADAAPRGIGNRKERPRQPCSRYS